MTEKEIPIAKHAVLTYTFSVYANRLEITKPSVFFVPVRIVIPFRSITSIQRHALTNRLTIHTNDGKKLTYPTGWATTKLYNALNSVV